MGLLLLGQEVEDSIPSPRQPLAFWVCVLLPLGRSGAQSPVLGLLSQPFLSVFFFGAVLYLFPFQPWGFPLLMTGKGASSRDLLHHPRLEQERATWE